MFKTFKTLIILADNTYIISIFMVMFNQITTQQTWGHVISQHSNTIHITVVETPLKSHRNQTHTSLKNIIKPSCLIWLFLDFIKHYIMSAVFLILFPLYLFFFYSTL